MNEKQECRHVCDHQHYSFLVSYLNPRSCIHLELVVKLMDSSPLAFKKELIVDLSPGDLAVLVALMLELLEHCSLCHVDVSLGKIEVMIKSRTISIVRSVPRFSKPKDTIGSLAFG
jgi:hypothetical protein